MKYNKIAKVIRNDILYSLTLNSQSHSIRSMCWEKLCSVRSVAVAC